MFGSDLALAPTDSGAGATFVQVVPRTGAMVPVTAPVSGVLTSLKVSHGAVGGGGTKFGFRILAGSNPYVARPATPDGSTVPQVSLVAGAAGGISEYLPKDAMGQPTGVAIQAGEHIALSVVGSTIFANTAAAGGFYQFVFGDHGSGSLSYTPGVASSVEILAQGTIEPDADRDGYGDETQDRCVGVRGSVSGCPDPNAANNSSPVAVNVVGRPSVGVNVAAPELSSVSASPSRFRLGSLLPELSRRAAVGTTIKFTLSEAASAKVEFLQSRAGRRVGKRCKAPTRTNRNHKRCTRTVVAGSLTVFGHAGKNKLRFQGRVSKHKTLKPGRYTLRITATDKAGNTSKAKTTTITILKG